MLMIFKLSGFIRSLLKATSFWKDNYPILREFKYFRWIAVSALFFMLLSAAFEAFGIGFLLAFLQNLIAPAARPVHTGFSWFDVWILGVNSPATERLYRVSALILLITILRTAFSYLGFVYSEKANQSLADRLRKRVFEQLQGLALSYFSKTRSGELINSITGEIYQTMQAFGVTSGLITRGSTLLAYMISMYASVALEFINGIRTIQAFATQDFERRRFYDASLQLKQAGIKAVAVSASMEPLAEAGATSILIGILILAFTTLIPPHGNLSPTKLLTFLFVLFRLMPIVRQVNGCRAMLSSFQGPLANIKELLRTDNKTYLQDGKVQFSGLEQAIEFVSVDFGYDASHLVLHDITLAIKRGQMTALVGASGAGKTTLADLIPRFYDPIQGQILIDGLDLREFEIKSLRRKLAVVSQDTFIFNTSIRNNIAYGSEGADESAILEVARLANALEFILEMPEGFETQLGDRGVRLSGGQRQRIAIARALLRDPDILILDEATSALDSVSERLIQESLEKLSVGRTVIAIAHRLSTIVRADKVVVLEQGRIVEQGGYRELLEQRGKLWKYHQMQHELGRAH